MGARVQHRPVYRGLCELLRDWRVQAQLSQAKLAQLLGKPPSYVHKCEVADRRIDPVEFIQWYRLCGLSGEAALQQTERMLADYGQLPERRSGNPQQ